MHCALIDDDAQFLRSMELAFGPSSRFLAIERADEAIQGLSRFKGQVVFVDIQLGAVDGFSLIGQIRAKFPWMKIVITSAYLDKGNLLRAVRSKVDEVLEKPFRLEEFVAIYQKLNSPHGLTLDHDHFCVNFQGESVAMTKTEFTIVAILFQNAGTRISKADLQKQVWGELVVARNTLDTHLTNIRRKAPWLRRSLHSVNEGYILTAEAVIADADSESN